MQKEKRIVAAEEVRGWEENTVGDQLCVKWSGGGFFRPSQDSNSYSPSLLFSTVFFFRFPPRLECLLFSSAFLLTWWCNCLQMPILLCTHRAHKYMWIHTPFVRELHLLLPPFFPSTCWLISLSSLTLSFLVHLYSLDSPFHVGIFLPA